MYVWAKEINICSFGYLFFCWYCCCSRQIQNFGDRRWHRRRRQTREIAEHITLDRSFHVTHFERTVVYRFTKQEQCHQKQTDVGNVHSTVILCVGQRAIGNTHTDCKENQSPEEQQIAPFAAKVCTDRWNLATVRAPGQIILQCVKQERIVTMTTGDAAHAGHR